MILALALMICACFAFAVLLHIAWGITLSQDECDDELDAYVVKRLRERRK